MDRNAYLLTSNRTKLVAHHAEGKALEERIAKQLAEHRAKGEALLAQQDIHLAALNGGKVENAKPGSKGGTKAKADKGAAREKATAEKAKAREKADAEKAKAKAKALREKAAKLRAEAGELIAGAKGDKSAKGERARTKAAKLKTDAISLNAHATALLDGLKIEKPAAPAATPVEKPKAAPKPKAEPKPKAPRKPKAEKVAEPAAPIAETPAPEAPQDPMA